MKILKRLIIIICIVAVIFLSLVPVIKDKNFNKISLCGYKGFKIMSGSMEPELNINDIVIGRVIRNKNQLKEGDIIAYKYEDIVVIHRIINITEDGYYILKGDNNEAADIKPVNYNQILFKIINTKN